ncbi:MAG: DUF1854 domain-containing protein [Armatimonadetes bacterium]|nr:DUF1854 domain-containing protein [Armatimonadota bacterium]
MTGTDTAGTPAHGETATTNGNGAAARVESQVLDPARLRLSRGPHGEFRLVVEDDRCYLNCRASWCFPFSDRRRYVALFDGLKGEVGVLHDPATLDEASQTVLSEMLDRRYFVPVIERIRSIREEYGVVYWSVVTDQGPRDFVCRGLRDSVIELADGRLIVSDVDGNRFEIPDYTTLSRAAQAILDRVL